MSRSAPLVACLAMASAIALPAAQFRSSVDTVAVWATVDDGHGRLVTDLGPNDFKIFDNGIPRDIAQFSSDPQPITVVVMLDMSGSMMSRFLKVRESTLRFVNALRPGDRAQIGSFGEEVAINPLLTGDKDILTRVVHEELWPVGSTPLWNAADGAMSALAAESGRRVILMLTDGADSCNFPDCVKFSEVEKRATREGFMVYAIAMDERGIGTELVSLTEATGGGHFELNTGDDLTTTFVRVVEELRHQYLLGFVPGSLDGKEHVLVVGATRPGLRVRARNTYVASRAR